MIKKYTILIFGGMLANLHPLSGCPEANTAGRADAERYNLYAESMDALPNAVLVCPFAVDFKKVNELYYRAEIKLTVVAKLKGAKEVGEIIQAHLLVESKETPKLPLGILRIAFFGRGEGRLLIDSGCFVKYEKDVWQYLERRNAERN